jgi:hypothetical protein
MTLDLPGFIKAIEDPAELAKLHDAVAAGRAAVEDAVKLVADVKALSAGDLAAAGKLVADVKALLDAARPLFAEIAALKAAVPA